MSNHPIYLSKYRLSSTQRAHFAIFIPNLGDTSNDPNNRSAASKGTLINVVGAPMTGYAHEFKPDHCCTDSVDLERLVSVGPVQLTEEGFDDEAIAKALETVALQLPAPGRNENFLAPVNDATNRRCQEWTMDYIRLLVNKGYVDAEAIASVQAERDSPNHGVGFRSIRPAS